MLAFAFIVTTAGVIITKKATKLVMAIIKYFRIKKIVIIKIVGIVITFMLINQIRKLVGIVINLQIIKMDL